MCDISLTIDHFEVGIGEWESEAVGCAARVQALILMGHVINVEEFRIIPRFTWLEDLCQK